MINFIIVCELDFWEYLIEDKIDKSLFKSELEYKIYKFKNYNEEFYKIAFKNLENKVFIFDLDIKYGNGFEIAKRIRNNDKLSEIILIGDYKRQDYIESFLISSIKAIAFIDKNKLNILEEKIDEVIRNYNLNKLLIIKTISSLNIIKIMDILYIETKNRKTIIHTINSIITTSKSLSYFEKKLNMECDYFIKTHRASIVNYLNVIEFNFKNKTITFYNNKKSSLLSKSYKDLIQEKLKNK